jgi:hypothetical protein
MLTRVALAEKSNAPRASEAGRDRELITMSIHRLGEV